MWTPSPTGAYTAASTWDKLRDHHPAALWYDLIWVGHNVPRMSFILWLAIRKKVYKKVLESFMK